LSLFIIFDVIITITPDATTTTISWPPLYHHQLQFVIITIELHVYVKFLVSDCHNVIYLSSEIITIIIFIIIYIMLVFTLTLGQNMSVPNVMLHLFNRIC